MLRAICNYATSVHDRPLSRGSPRQRCCSRRVSGPRSCGRWCHSAMS